MSARLRDEMPDEALEFGDDAEPEPNSWSWHQLLELARIARETYSAARARHLRLSSRNAVAQQLTLGAQFAEAVVRGERDRALDVWQLAMDWAAKVRGGGIVVWVPRW